MRGRGEGREYIGGGGPGAWGAGAPTDMFAIFFTIFLRIEVPGDFGARWLGARGLFL